MTSPPQEREASNPQTAPELAEMAEAAAEKISETVEKVEDKPQDLPLNRLGTNGEDEPNRRVA